jgi:hypothetical protein
LHRDSETSRQIHTSSSINETPRQYRLREPGYYYLSDTGEFTKCAELPAVTHLAAPIAIVERPTAPEKIDKYCNN